MLKAEVRASQPNSPAEQGRHPAMQGGVFPFSIPSPPEFLLCQGIWGRDSSVPRSPRHNPSSPPQFARSLDIHLRTVPAMLPFRMNYGSCSSCTPLFAAATPSAAILLPLSASSHGVLIPAE